MLETSKLFQPELFYRFIFFISIFVFASIMVFSGSPANADVYKYTDKNGDVVFTDDLSRVPHDQRDSALMIKEKENKTGTGKVIESIRDKKAAGKESGSENTSERKKNRNELVKQKSELEKESQQLKAQRKELEEMERSVQSKKERQVFNDKLTEYNRRIEAHNEKQQRLHEKIEEFNQSLAD